MAKKEEFQQQMERIVDDFLAVRFKLKKKEVTRRI